MGGTFKVLQSNQVIPDRKIVDLEFIDKEMHPVERDAKGVVYDMFCKTDSGARIIVEVQRRKQLTPMTSCRSMSSTS